MTPTDPDSRDQEPEKEESTPFGDTFMGESLGCATSILAAGLGLAAILWAMSLKMH